MKPILLTAILLLAITDASAIEREPQPDLAVIHEILRKAPDALVLEGSTRYVMVNDRFEHCTSRKEARREGRYIKRITPATDGWSVSVLTFDGVVLLDATSSDPDGHVLHGACSYYDGDHRLRAQGQYINGLKTGVWKRFDANGAEMPDKVYYGEDWDALQVRVGLATMCNTLGTVAPGGE